MMKRCVGGCSVIALALMLHSPARSAQQPQSSPAAISVRTASVDGVNLQYLIAGHGPTIVMLHRYAETARMWRPLMPRLASRFTVIAPDLPGIGGSAIPNDGLDMTHAASRVHMLVNLDSARQLSSDTILD
jgi:alpha-beta hydrolase superfamily lysophospholipase